MLTTIRNTARNPLAIVSILIVIAVAIALALLIVPRLGTDSESAGQSGGGGLPPKPLLEVYDSLPLPPRVAVQEAPVSTGYALMAFYWAQDTPDKVLSFYQRELVAQGWRQETAPTTPPSDIKDDGTQAVSQVATFIRDDLRLTIGAAPNTKDPARGATHFGITIEPQ